MRPEKEKGEERRLCKVARLLGRDLLITGGVRVVGDPSTSVGMTFFSRGRKNVKQLTGQPLSKIGNQRCSGNLRSKLFQCFPSILMCPETTVFSVRRKQILKFIRLPSATCMDALRFLLWYMPGDRVVALADPTVNSSPGSARPSSVLLVGSWPRLLLVFFAGAGRPKWGADNHHSPK
ncbi:hypothetical protein CRG98_005946 [Punica granatum]|uniref:Uncharacterized protein n=1 Tax=Punica granatum TaxID=22663 RepID=A0A2I0KZ08_PUNGR|nr:hypothetical protein CRG98_005946 [Punica granatum]